MLSQTAKTVPIFFFVVRPVIKTSCMGIMGQVCEVLTRRTGEGGKWREVLVEVRKIQQIVKHEVGRHRKSLSPSNIVYNWRILCTTKLEN
jgi:hypothetical protein